VSLFQSVKPLLGAFLLALVSVIIFYGQFDYQGLQIEPVTWPEQPWTLVTTHLVHLNMQHLWVNVAALLIISIIFSSYYSTRIFLNVFIICAICASAFPLFLGTPISFVGLSGLLHGLYAYGAVHTLKTNRYFGALMLALLVFKLAWDLYNANQSVAWLDGATVAYWAHIGGAFGGVLAIPLLKRKALELLSKEE